MIDPDQNNHGVGNVFKFLQYDFKDHTKDEEHAKNILQLFGDLKSQIKGCLTLSEASLMLTIRLCTELKLPNIGHEVAVVVNSKAITMDYLTHNEKAKPLASNYCYIKDEESLLEASDNIGFPAVLKPDSGSDRFGVIRVDNDVDLKNEYRRLRDVYGFKKLNGGLHDTMILTEYLDGPSYLVDIALFQGELIYSFVCDQAPSISRKFIGTTYCIPSNLPVDAINKIKDEALNACIAIGLVNGVAHVEFIWTKNGLKLVEINAFIGGLSRQNLIKKIYDVDTLKCYTMISCGHRSDLPNEKPKFCGIEAKCYPTYHRERLMTKDAQRILKDIAKDEHIQLASIATGIATPVNKDFEKPCLRMAVCGKNFIQTKARVLEICSDLDLNVPGFDFRELLGCL